MKAIYLDNFRGFTDTWVPLKDVNFLVGENSTGKTSLLALLSLFYDFDFWFTGEFNTTDFQLGGFRDIVSAEVRNRRCFQVGYLYVPHSQTNATLLPLGFTLRFVDEDGRPSLDRFHIMYGNRAVRAEIARDKPIYAMRTLPKADKGSFERTFAAWVEEGNNPGAYPKRFLRTLPPWSPKRVPIMADLFFNLLSTRSRKRIKGTGTRSALRPITSLFAGNRCRWIAPIRSEPRPVYADVTPKHSSGGEHIPYLLRNLKQRKDSQEWGALNRFLARFGKTTGLFRKVDVHKFGAAHRIRSPWR